jgi:hypothetical protein
MFGPTVHKFLNSVRMRCFWLGVKQYLCHLTVAHFRYIFVSADVLVVLDLLINLLLDLNTYYS